MHHTNIERTKRFGARAFTVQVSALIFKMLSSSAPNVKKKHSSLQKEPMTHHLPPSRPFKDVSADLFSHVGKSYPVNVDRLSGWIKISEF